MKKFLYMIIFLCIIIILICICYILYAKQQNNLNNDSSIKTTAATNNYASEETTETTTILTTETAAIDYAQVILDSMSLDEKIHQLFFITPEDITDVNTATVAGKSTRESIASHPVGGIIFFSQNFQTDSQAKSLISETKAIGNEVCKIPLFIAIDEEGGTIARLANSTAISVPKVENMSAIGASGDSSKAYAVGKTIGTYLKDFGFNVDFAPVADVLTNPENQVVKLRSFGPNPQINAEMSYQFSKGLNECGIYSCYKHFPGHGATVADSHKGFAYTNKTYEQMLNSELVPFINAINNNADFIMVGHISTPNITGDNTPASISPVIINDILKTRLGYKGLVITDALNMQALTNLYTSDQIAVKALNAGVDMLLMPADFNLAYNGVKNAVANGTVSEERLNDAVKKIITAKLKMMS